MAKNSSSVYLSGDIRAVYEADCRGKKLSMTVALPCPLCGAPVRNLPAHMQFRHSDSEGQGPAQK